MRPTPAMQAPVLKDIETDAGFTLIETLIALAITAMLAVSGTILLTQTLTASEAVEARLDETRRIDVLHGLMRDDLRYAIARGSAGPDTQGTDTVFSGVSSAVEGPLMAFTRSGWTNPDGREARSELQRVQWFLREGTLVRRAWLRSDPVRDTPVVERDLVTDIAGARLRYFSGDQWVSDWPETAQTLPRLVELVLEFEDAGELRHVFLLELGQ